MRSVVLATLLFLPSGRGAEPAKDTSPPVDPWVGEFQRIDRGFGNRNEKKAEKVAISKQADGSYRLSGWYKMYKFTETEKGVLSDGTGGIGRLVLERKKIGDNGERVIRAEFCYESFLLLNP